MHLACIKLLLFVRTYVYMYHYMFVQDGNVKYVIFFAECLNF